MTDTSIGLVGAGRLGSALARALATHGSDVLWVASATPAHAERLAHEVGAEVVEAGEVPGRADLTLLTVPDQALPEVAIELVRAGPGPRPGAAVVHCSGATSVTVLEPLAEAGWSTGSWHPLQSVPTLDATLKAGAGHHGG